MLQAAHILQGQLHPKKRSRSEDEGSNASCFQLFDQPQPPLAATAFSPPQLSHLSSASQPGQLTLSTPSSADVISRASVSPDGNSQVRTHSSSIKMPSHIHRSASQQIMTHLLRPGLQRSDLMSMTQAMRRSSLPAQLQHSESPSLSLRPGLATQPAARGVQVQTQDQSWSTSQHSTGQMIPCQSAMTTWLSPGGADSSPMQHDVNPMSPSQSDRFASLFPPDDNSRQLSCSPDIQLPSDLLSSQDSPASHLSSRSRGASQPKFLHYSQDSQQPSPALNMSQPASKVQYSAPDSSLGLHDSDLLMLREAIAAAAQPQAPPQHSALEPQSARPAPLASPPKIAKSASQPVLDPRLRARSFKSREKDSDLRPAVSKAMSWPQSGPYNIQRWQRVLLT